MKNAITYGVLIGIFSGLWMFVMRWLGYSPQKANLAPIEYFSVLIPIIILYFGVKQYRDVDSKGHLGFLPALMQSFKILLIGGVIAVFAAITYIEEFSKGSSIGDFSGRVFGALLVGLLFALGVSALMTTRHNKVD
ncbi:MAG TPA: DUF4199 domain-containing protein [Mucilaginibacter sp.]|jgi:membrane protease YdiL (CAAX protease family)